MTDLPKLRACFQEALVLPPGTTVDDLQYAKHPAWDSVAHMRLIAAIERDFDVMFTTDQILDLSSFAEAQRMLADHGK